MNRWLMLVPALALSTVIQAQQFEGTLDWGQLTTLSSPLNGKISSVKVYEGERVKEGALLATIDPRPFQAREKRAKAMLKGLTTRYDDAAREYTRAQELYERTVLSQTDLQAAEVRYFSAEADKNQAEAELLQAKVELEYTQLRAPYSGLVIERNINPQEVVSNQLNASPMIRLASTDTMKASFWVPPQSAANLKSGDSVKVTVEGNAYDATVRHVGLTSKREHQQVLTTVAVTLPNSNGTLYAGRVAHIDLP